MKAKKPPAPYERIDHPAHYGGRGSPIEHIKVVEALGWNYNIGNCTKYLFRLGRKPGAEVLVDLRKALFYLRYEIARVEREVRRHRRRHSRGKAV